MLSIIISICLLLLSIFGGILSIQLPLFNDPHMLFSTKPSFYPLIIWGGLACCSLIYAIKSILNKVSSGTILNKKVLVYYFLFVSYIISLVYLKFIASTFLFNFIGGYYLLENKIKKSIIKLSIISGCITLVLYILFIKFFNVPL